MRFIDSILGKLGIGTKGEAASSAPPAGAAPVPATPTATGGAATPTPPPTYTPASAAPPPANNGPTPTEAPINPIPVVDVMAQLEKRAAANAQKLNWRTSIVDLLKLLDIDSSLDARKALAKELYCPPELMQDSARMNVWLHKNVLGHIAANGGNVPKELTD